MDITRYIGLFLLKNNFCYIHGLGNLALKKRPAAPDGETLKGPEYEVQLTPTGSIDDNLANFIAVNEQISIAKASNALRDFSIHARAELLEGREVIIPALGRFVQKDNIIRFITDPHLQYSPPAIPTVRIAKKTEEKEEKKITPRHTNQDITRAKSANRTRTFIWLLIVAIVAAGIIFGIKFISEQTTASAPEPAPVMAPQLPEPEAEYPYDMPDTGIMEPGPATEETPLPGSSTEPVSVTGNLLSYEVVINQYDNLLRADKREKQLTSFGNTVRMRTKDSLTYYVVMPMSTPAADTAHVLDSLRKLFNPQGVHIYR